jgi:hypothetical protein
VPVARMGSSCYLLFSKRLARDWTERPERNQAPKTTTHGLGTRRKCASSVGPTSTPYSSRAPSRGGEVIWQQSTGNADSAERRDRPIVLRHPVQTPRPASSQAARRFSSALVALERSITSWSEGLPDEPAALAGIVCAELLVGVKMAESRRRAAGRKARLCVCTQLPSPARHQRSCLSRSSCTRTLTQVRGGASAPRQRRPLQRQ